MRVKTGRNVSLGARQDALIQRLVKGGRYATASEVVREGLRLLEKQEHLRLLDKWLAEGLTPHEEASLPPGFLDRARREINAKIREGLDSIERGEGIDGDAFFKRWRAKVDRTVKSGPGRRSA